MLIPLQLYSSHSTNCIAQSGVQASLAPLGYNAKDESEARLKHFLTRCNVSLCYRWELEEVEVEERGGGGLPEVCI